MSATGAAATAAAGVVLSLAALALLGACTDDGSLEVAKRVVIGNDTPIPEIQTKVQGEVAPCGRYPYMVSLRTSADIHKCGGVLISPRWVLTAAHCVDPDDPNSAGVNPVVVVGACNLDDTKNKNGKVELSRSDEIFRHPSWNGNATNGGDIALVKLKARSKHKHAELPTSYTVPQPYQILLALGWGGNVPKRDLQQATGVTVLDWAICRKPDIWGNAIKDSMFCAYGPGNADVTCGGDSGGPILMPFNPDGCLECGKPELDVVIGLTSFGKKYATCGSPDKPGVYTAVPSFLKWIDKIQGPDKNDNGTPPPTPPSPLPPCTNLKECISQGDTDKAATLIIEISSDEKKSEEEKHNSIQRAMDRACDDGNFTEMLKALLKAANDGGNQGVLSPLLEKAHVMLEIC